ncbi:ATP-binding protein [Haematobacter massiliensis]|uniref:histidine kinase n=1 Tax=Haematobacter massiliensis TaxID=195105 RepID=A0A086Y2W3_9RHOB|nr:ATP-binding protein [Haematobacter massiliensis]KFI28613.1 ATPase [Haematobacter massiliensis]OWJ74087.1 ATP-binding protein [Haematobacter massiliensis]OWJ88548.1 ATP-binding protein [Haematobacter massiliensis]QBJ26159.1 sensor histidine kinase [Haematobacter massiliensis]
MSIIPAPPFALPIPRAAMSPGLFLAVVATLAATALAGRESYRRGIAALDRSLADRHSITADGLTAEIERLRYLPRILGEDPRLRAVLAAPEDAQAVAAANSYLKAARGVTGADELYLIGSDGITLAASNWNEPGSFLGMDYSFRPYFRDALVAGMAQYYAVGVTTGRPGAFLSARLDAATNGVAVAKMELGALEIAWARAGEMTAVADPDGMVFLASQPAWRFRPLSPLGSENISRIEAERRYPSTLLSRAEPLPISGLTLTHPEAGELRIHTGPVQGTDWTLLVALPTEEAWRSALLAALITGSLGALVSAGAVVLRQRRQLIRIRLRQAADLEARVQARTRELAAEVEERRRAEEELLQTHERLVHAAKLAVLGRMSTAIVHEIGQSLSALDNNLAAAEAHGDAGRRERLASALARSRGMVGRLQGVASRLRSFGRRQVSVPPETVPLAPVLATAVEIVTPRARELSVQLVLPDTPMPSVRGDGPRLEQVLTNLLLNAIDATGRSPEPRRVCLSAIPDRKGVRIEITDTGPGLPPGAEGLIEPFVTGDPGQIGGQGLGLGLSIVQSLLEQMQGELSLANHPAGTGALVTIHLPAADAEGLDEGDRG